MISEVSYKARKEYQREQRIREAKDATWNEEAKKTREQRRKSYQRSWRTNKIARASLRKEDEMRRQNQQQRKWGIKPSANLEKEELEENKWRSPLRVGVLKTKSGRQFTNCSTLSLWPGAAAVPAREWGTRGVPVVCTQCARDTAKKNRIDG